MTLNQHAPEYPQVADRWHLLKNLGENTLQFLDRQRSLIKEVDSEVFVQEKPDTAMELPQNGLTTIKWTKD